MKDKLIRRGSIALMGVLSAVGVGYATSSAAATPVAPLADTPVDYRPSEWATASNGVDPRKAPSLTADSEELIGGNGSQSWLGYGLVGAGLLALTLGLAAGGGRSRSAPGRPSAHATNWGRRHAPPRTHARS